MNDIWKAIVDFLGRFIDPALKELIRVSIANFCQWLLTPLYQRLFNIGKPRSETQGKEAESRKPWKAYLCCVIIAVVCIVVYYYLVQRSTSNTNNLPAMSATASIAAAPKDVILVTCDGTIITIDSSRIKNNELSADQFEELLSGPQCKNKECNTLIVPAGRWLKVPLPDGTVAHMNPASSLCIRAGFAVNHRDLNLVGEAFFVAARNPFLPLRVRTKDAVTTALGTSFKIRAYENLSYLQVSVTSGSVRVAQQKNNIVLHKNTGVTIRRESGALTREKLDPSMHLAWLNGEYYMEGQPLDEVFKELARRYDTDFVIPDSSIRKETVRGTLERQQPINSHLEWLGNAHHFSFEKKNGKWYIYRSLINFQKKTL